MAAAIPAQGDRSLWAVGASAALLVALFSGCAVRPPAGLRDGQLIELDGHRYRIERLEKGGAPLVEVAPGWLDHPQRGLLALHEETANAYFLRITESPTAPSTARAKPPSSQPLATAAGSLQLRPRGRLVEVDSALPRHGEWREQFAVTAHAERGARLLATPEFREWEAAARAEA